MSRVAYSAWAIALASARFSSSSDWPPGTTTSSPKTKKGTCLTNACETSIFAAQHVNVVAACEEIEGGIAIHAGLLRECDELVAVANIQTVHKMCLEQAFDDARLDDRGIGPIDQPMRIECIRDFGNLVESEAETDCASRGADLRQSRFYAFRTVPAREIGLPGEPILRQSGIALKGMPIDFKWQGR